MFAIMQLSGKQVKVEEGQVLLTDRLPEDEGKSITVKEVLLVSDGKKTTVGAPFVKGAEVKATVVEHAKDDKILVFKKKRRKGYKKTIGHRQALTQIKIESIKA